MISSSSEAARQSLGIPCFSSCLNLGLSIFILDQAGILRQNLNTVNIDDSVSNSTHSNYNNSMLLPEQIYPHIPKRLAEWSPSDVQLWFSLHCIATKPSFDFQEHYFDGPAFLVTTPEYLFDVCGVGSVIVIKKIIEWLEQEVEEFQEFVEHQNNLKPKEQNQEGSPRGFKRFQIEIEDLDKQNTPKNNQFEVVQSKYLEAVQPLQNVKKWKQCKKKSFSCEEKYDNISEQIIQVPAIRSSKCIANSVKFAESNYEICQHLLRFEYEMQVSFLGNNGKIGRNKAANDVVIFQDSVSREHAQVLRVDNDYYLQDVGSKYGTFREIGVEKNRSLEEEDELAFDDFQVQIIHLKIHHNKSFDIKVKVTAATKKTIMNFYIRKAVSIGRQGKDINLNHPNIPLSHARLVLHNDNRIYLVKEEGQSFLKLKKEELYHLEEDQVIRFGLQKVRVSLFRKSKPVRNVSEFSLLKG